MQLDFGLIPPVLLPLGTTAALNYILDSVDFDDSYVGLGDEMDRVQDYLVNKQLGCKLIKLSKDGDISAVDHLGKTIYDMLDTIELDIPDSIIINFGDTIIIKDENTKFTGDDDEIYISRVEDTFRWTTVKKVTEGFCFQDKNSVADSGEADVIVGLFYLRDAILFKKILGTVVADVFSGNVYAKKDIFYIALEKYLNIRNSAKLLETESWIDLGHLDTYYQSKAKFLNARHFNSFEIDLFWGKIRKKSVYQKKFIDEINWYVNLPGALKSLIPNVYSYSTTEPIYVEMEYYGYPTLNQIYLFSNISVAQWKNVFVKLLSIQSQFQSFEAEIDSIYFKSFYLDKTKQRINELRKNPSFADFFHHEVVINGVTYPSLSDTVDSLEDFIQTKICNTEVLGGIIHGDFCLSNVLYDTKTGIVKLIDPRGSFIDNNLFGDPRYDLAKISHSVHGFYDLILAGNYTLTGCKNNYSFNIISTDQHSKLSSLFLQLMSKSGIDVKQILAIESTLFLSMVPLHADDLNRQKAFLLRGIQLYYS